MVFLAFTKATNFRRCREAPPTTYRRSHCLWYYLSTELETFKDANLTCQHSHYGKLAEFRTQLEINGILEILHDHRSAWVGVFAPLKVIEPGIYKVHNLSWTSDGRELSQTAFNFINITHMRSTCFVMDQFANLVSKKCHKKLPFICQSNCDFGQECNDENITTTYEVTSRSTNEAITTTTYNGSTITTPDNFIPLSPIDEVSTNTIIEEVATMNGHEFTTKSTNVATNTTFNKISTSSPGWSFQTSTTRSCGKTSRQVKML